MSWYTLSFYWLFNCIKFTCVRMVKWPQILFILYVYQPLECSITSLGSFKLNLVTISSPIFCKVHYSRLYSSVSNCFYLAIHMGFPSNSIVFYFIILSNCQNSGTYFTAESFLITESHNLLKVLIRPSTPLEVFA